MNRPYRPRRSCLAVPGSSSKMLTKAQGLSSDQVFLDLEDSVAPNAKAAARAAVSDALNHGDWSGKTRVVRINDAETEWAHEDVMHVVSQAGTNIDCIMLPKVESISHVHWIDLLLTQVEKSAGLPVGGIGLEVQIEGPGGLTDIDAIAGASPRLETLIFGPGDFMAEMQMPALTIAAPERGEGNPFDGVLLGIAVAARKHGVQAIDGPFARIRDVEGYSRAAQHAALFGFDGKWVLHPGQIEAANEAFSPSQADFDKAELILEAYEYWTSEAGGSLGAVMLGDEMIDEASRKMAMVTATRGRRLNMERTTSFQVPAS